MNKEIISIDSNYEFNNIEDNSDSRYLTEHEFIINDFLKKYYPKLDNKLYLPYYSLCAVTMLDNKGNIPDNTDEKMYYLSLFKEVCKSLNLQEGYKE